MRGASRRSALAGIAGLLALAIALPAQALPGQTLAGFKTWAAGEKLLAGIGPFRNEFDRTPGFDLQTADHGIAWTFRALSNGSTIVSESLAIGRPGKQPGTEPVRHDGHGYGFTFFTSLYGAAVVADFRSSTLVATFRSQSSAGTTTFFRGSTYGYEVVDDVSKGISTETSAEFDRQLALYRRCAKSPQNCSE